MAESQSTTEQPPEKPNRNKKACFERYNQQLGMHCNQARQKLHRILLFSLAQQCGKAVCFRCELPIESVEEFSVDHKKPWRNVDPALYWDLDNIAFSHWRCNTLARRNPPSFRVDLPEGMSWCYGCKQLLPVTDFTICKTALQGLNEHCRSCAKARAAKRHKKRRRHRVEVPSKRALYEHRMANNLCSQCGEPRPETQKLCNSCQDYRREQYRRRRAAGKPE